MWMSPHRRWVVALLMLAVAATVLAVVLKQIAFLLWIVATALVATALVIEFILIKRRY